MRVEATEKDPQAEDREKTPNEKIGKLATVPRYTRYAEALRGMAYGLSTITVNTKPLQRPRTQASLNKIDSLAQLLEKLEKLENLEKLARHRKLDQLSGNSVCQRSLLLGHILLVVVYWI